MAKLTATDLNRCFMRFRDRAERTQADQIINTFVSVGPLLHVLSSENNQIVYGRRGTGKTHALLYLANQMKKSGDISIYVDCQNLGSNQSIYDDKTLPLTERATRLLIDVCSALHSALLEIITEPEFDFDLSRGVPLLDELTEAISEVRMVGQTEKETASKQEIKDSSTSKFDIGLSKDPKATFYEEDVRSRTVGNDLKTRRTGVETSWITFGRMNQVVKSIAAFMKRRIWVFVDEWSTVPSELQPYLADLIKRVFFSTPTITVKIAAIEHRSFFKIERTESDYIGFELGADASTAVNLDDYLVFDNDEHRSTQFFKTMIGNHARYIAAELKLATEVSDDEIISNVFSQVNVFTEIVKASEGVPRDAMHIISNAAQSANVNLINMPIVRHAALHFFQAEKYSVIQANPENRRLLDWIRDEVIGSRRTRAFLLPLGTKDPIVDRLFDLRALHIKNRSMSSAHNPGERYIVYKLDYGCYADLINTVRSPTGMLTEGVANFDVPDDDGRSFRRAILNLNKFYDANKDIVRQ